jgi:hypothetical protein
MTVKIVHRGLLITGVAGGLILASQPLASAAIQPAAVPTPASIVKAAPAIPGVPGVPSGGAIDSVKGIAGGALAGATPVLGLPTLGLP